MNNKEKNTRIVTFKEDYFSKAGIKEGAQPIYKKGSVHAIHHLVVKSLQAKGAKIDVKTHDPAPGIARLKKQRIQNLKNSESTK